jgi:hypothetical protein
MRRTHRDHAREAGLWAAAKAIAIVFGVGMLALAAGNSAYMPNSGSATPHVYQSVEPAPEDAPAVGTYTPATGDSNGSGQHVLATAPSTVTSP